MLTADDFTVWLKQADLTSNNDIVDFVKKIYFDGKLKTLNEKITINKRKHVLIQNELKEKQDKINKITNHNVQKVWDSLL